jgi:hypothetical protein
MDATGQSQVPKGFCSAPEGVSHQMKQVSSMRSTLQLFRVVLDEFRLFRLVAKEAGVNLEQREIHVGALGSGNIS